MKTNPLFYIIPILCATQMVYAASTPDKKMVDVIGPVKTVVTVIEEETPDTLHLCLPYATIELAMAGVVYQNGDTLTNAVSFDKNGNFSHRVSLLEILAELDFSKYSPTENIHIEKGVFPDPEDFDFTDEQFYAYKLSLSRGVSGEILGFGGIQGWGWNDTKSFVYDVKGDPLSYTYKSGSDAYSDFCAVYSTGSFENDAEKIFEDDYALYLDHLKTMVVSQHLGGQDLMPLTVSVVEYNDYEFDKYGNWITRKAFAKTFKTESPFTDDQVMEEDDEKVDNDEDDLIKTMISNWTERRTITYYE